MRPTFTFLLFALAVPCSAALGQHVPAKPVRNVALQTPPLTTAASPTADTAGPAPVSPTLVVASGLVLDEQHKPLQGATVQLQGTTSITSTDAAGRYTLAVPVGINTLAFDYAGYQGRTVAASNFLPVTVQLLPAERTRPRSKH